MADYFSLLAGRTLGQAPALRPLVASRYGKERWSAEEPAVEYKSIERVAASRPAAAPPSPDTSSERFDRPQMRETSQSLPPVEARQRRLNADSREPSVERLEPFDEIAPSPRRESPSANVERQALDPERTSVPDYEWRLLPLTADHHAGQFRPRDQSGPHPRITDIKSPYQASAQEAPVVQVTIGRIDVRAVMPKSETAKPQPRPARRSPLENYLRTRNGERG